MTRPAECLVIEDDPQLRLAVLSGLEEKYRIAKFMAALGSPLWLGERSPGEESAAVRLEPCDQGQPAPQNLPR